MASEFDFRNIRDPYQSKMNIREGEGEKGKKFDPDIIRIRLSRLRNLGAILGSFPDKKRARLDDRRIKRLLKSSCVVGNKTLSTKSSKFLKNILIDFSLSEKNINSVSSFIDDVLRADSFLGIFSIEEKINIKKVKYSFDRLLSLKRERASSSKNDKIFNLWEGAVFLFNDYLSHFDKFFLESEERSNTIPTKLGEHLLECKDIYRYFKNTLFMYLGDSTPRNLNNFLKSIYDFKTTNNEFVTTLPANVIASVVSYTIRNIFKHNNDVLSDYIKQFSFQEFLTLLNEHKNNRNFLDLSLLADGLSGMPRAEVLPKGTLKFSFKPLSFLQEDWYKNFSKLKEKLHPLMDLIEELNGKFRAYRNEDGDFIVTVKFPRSKEVDNFDKFEDSSEGFYDRFSQARQSEYNNIDISFPLKNTKSSQLTNLLFPLSCVEEGEDFLEDLLEIGKLDSLKNLQTLIVKNSIDSEQDSSLQDVLMFFKGDNSSEAFIQIPRYFLKNKTIVDNLASLFKFSKAKVTLPFLSGTFVMGGTRICRALSTLISDFEKETPYNLNELELLCQLKSLGAECIIFDKNKNMALHADYDIKKKAFVLKDLL